MIFPTKKYVVFLASILLLITALPATGRTTDYNSLSKEELQKKIATFELGLGQYIVGKKLTEEQLANSAKDNAYKAYTGTTKFKDGNVYVIADEKNHVVIAVYERNKKAAKDDFKAMVGSLMLQYGEPTAEAHGKTIYWNYGPDGLISEELYRTAKSQGKLGAITVLATIKFSSSQNMAAISSSVPDPKDKDGEAGEVTSDNYVMIQSDLLSQKYMGQ